MTKETVKAEVEISVKGKIEFKLVTAFYQVWREDCCEKRKVEHGEGKKVPGELKGFEEKIPGWVGPKQTPASK